jgi:hypothetical protein
VKPDLHIVKPEPKTETVAERIRRLQAEARALASDHITNVTAALERAATSAKG